MSFNGSSYLAGVGTVVVVAAIGFGAGLHMTGMFDDPQGSNKLERRIAEQAAADESKSDADFKARAAQSDTGKTETKLLPGTTTIAASAPSVTAPEPAKPAVPVTPALVPAERMKQAFAQQPRASQPGPSAAPAQAVPVAQGQSQPVSSPAVSSASVAPPPTVAQSGSSQPAVQPAAPDDSVANPRDTAIEKAKAAAQKKAQQQRLAAERRRQREARLNAAAEWLRGQPADLPVMRRSMASGYYFSE